MCAIKKLLFATAMTSSACVFAVDHWVDAVNGNDDWDGLSSNYVSGAVGPKRTLQAAMDSLNGGWSHTVYALPGRYDAGGYAAEHARVCVKNRTRLISTGGKDVTFIVGSHTNGAPDSCDVGADVTRCVFMMFDGAVLQGFTLVGGRARKDKSNEYNGGGVYFQAYENGAPSYVVDCTITDCDASRGGGAYGIWSSPSACRFVNCLFTDNKSTSPGANIVKCHAWNCVFATPQCTLSSVSRCTLRNCTVYQAIDNTEAWNTLLPDARDDGSCMFHRCIT